MIDGHLHLWRLDRGDYGWLTPQQPALYRDFLPQHAQPLLAAAGVRRAVMVQAAATEAETRYLLDVASHHDWVAGVVGWADLAAPGVAQQVAALQRAGGGRLKGLRAMAQDMPDAAWLAAPALDAGFEALVAHGLVCDALVRPAHFPALAQRLARHPGMHTVLNHAGKPDIAHQALAPWAAGLHALAAHAGLTCKVSGLLTETAEASETADVDALRPFVQAIFAAFGPQRVMWGSDWPVLRLRADYAHWLGMAQGLVAECAPGFEPAVFGQTACRVYGLGP